MADGSPLDLLSDVAHTQPATDKRGAMRADGALPAHSAAPPAPHPAPPQAQPQMYPQHPPQAGWPPAPPPQSAADPALPVHPAYLQPYYAAHAPPALYYHPAAYSPHMMLHPAAIPYPAAAGGTPAPYGAPYVQPAAQFAMPCYPACGGGVLPQQHPPGMEARSPPRAGGRSGQRPRLQRRKSYTRFTAEEEEALMEGVRNFGAGNWKQILANSEVLSQRRSTIQLKDKYRTATRARQRAAAAVDSAAGGTGTASGASGSGGERQPTSSSAEAKEPERDGALQNASAVPSRGIAYSIGSRSPTRSPTPSSSPGMDDDSVLIERVGAQGLPPGESEDDHEVLAGAARGNPALGDAVGDNLQAHSKILEEAMHLGGRGVAHHGAGGHHDGGGHHGAGGGHHGSGGGHHGGGGRREDSPPHLLE